jgi:hypothetical protein
LKAISGVILQSVFTNDKTFALDRPLLKDKISVILQDAFLWNISADSHIPSSFSYK